MNFHRYTKAISILNACGARNEESYNWSAQIALNRLFLELEAGQAMKHEFQQ